MKNTDYNTIMNQNQEVETNCGLFYTVQLVWGASFFVGQQRLGLGGAQQVYKCF